VVSDPQIHAVIPGHRGEGAGDRYISYGPSGRGEQGQCAKRDEVPSSPAKSQQDQYENYNNDLVLHKKGGSEGQSRDGAG